MEELTKKLVVIGGGAAGMFAAILAARKGWNVVLLEKNEKLGKKLFITGKGRCNITNACDMEELFNHIVTGRKFMYSVFYGFHNYDMMDFLEELGLPLKEERGLRVFPKSDKSSDVIRVFEKELKRQKVQIKLHTKVVDIEVADMDVTNAEVELFAEEKKESKGKKKQLQKSKVYRVCAKEGNMYCYFPADAVFIATGGLSYPSTGSTGDGYYFAEKTGHTIIDPIPALVPLETKETFVKDFMGLSLKNIAISIYRGKKKLTSDFGELLFTHFGVSGPVILSASSVIARELLKSPLQLSIDLKPALSKEQLDTRLLRDFMEMPNKQFKNAFDKLLPKTLRAFMVEKTGISKEKKINLITKEERQNIVNLLKDFRLTLIKSRGFSEAVITQGGVAVKDINPSTMESKKVKGLYFIGEVLDVDALTGGFNLQIAWSSAALAAKSLS